MSLLRVRDLDVAIHGAPILKDLSIDVARGEIVALTGESGSGKSMTALAIMGLLPGGFDARGEIVLDGEDLTQLSEERMCAVRGFGVGMIFQEPMTALNPVQTIGAQITEGLRLPRVGVPALSAREADAEAERILDRVGLPPDRFALSRYPHELSGGQRQRVVIAIAIAQRPKLLIADEPTTALDVTTQAQILKLLQDLVRDLDMGLLMITHDLAVVHGMADRIVVMRHGEIVEHGPTAQLFARMEHPYTRALFDASRHRAALGTARAGAQLLEVESVSRDYPLPRRMLAPRRHFRAVNDVSFAIKAGERVGLVGESGCGKSTLTRAILGLDPVTEGDIRLGGAPVWNHGVPDPKVRRRMQVVFQDPYGSFNPRHRVARLISEPFHLLDTPPEGAARDDAINAALTAVGLSPDDKTRYIHAFSGGQRQRIAIARALIIRPDLIVFDEAVSALDVRVRAQILDLIADLSKTHGLAYLFISHDLSVVRGITDRVMVMQAGRIVEEGPTAQVFDAPDHEYTRRLVAAAPMLPAENGAAATG